MRTTKLTAILIAIGLLAGCAGGGGTSQAPFVAKPISSPTLPATQTAQKVGRVKATIVFPKAKKTAGLPMRGRRREYVSPNTEGLIIQVDQNGSVFSTTGYDLTTNSTNTTCTPVAGGTSCTFAFNAPATMQTSSDEFFIYAYDQPQPASPGVPASPVPVQTINPGGPVPRCCPAPVGTPIPQGPPVAGGYLLSQDTGPAGNGDPVPSNANPGILPDQDNSLTFVLNPVVFMPVSNIGGTPESGDDSLVLSIPGNGGTSNTVSIDGYDAGNGKAGNEISSYLAGMGDDVYVNPMSLTTTTTSNSTTDFVPNPTSLASALSDGVSVSWSAATAANDQPTSATSTPYSGTLTATASLTNGGFEGLSGFGPNNDDIQVAPLFGYASTNSVAAGFASTVSIYALQSAIPTGQSASSYSIAPDPTVAGNNCSQFAASPPATTGLAPGQQAMWTITATTGTVTGTSCTYAVTDGISSTDVAIQVVSSTGTITIPSSSAFTFAPDTSPETIVCPLAQFQLVGCPGENGNGPLIVTNPSSPGDTFGISCDPSSDFPCNSGKFFANCADGNGDFIGFKRGGANQFFEGIGQDGSVATFQCDFTFTDLTTDQTADYQVIVTQVVGPSHKLKPRSAR